MKQEGLTFELDQVTFWDEIHMKQKCGTKNHSTLVFARNDDGIYDENAEIDKTQRRVSSFMLLNLCSFYYENIINCSLDN